MNQPVQTGLFRLPVFLIFTLLVGLNINTAQSQAPASDACVNATPIDINGGWVSGSNVGTIVNGPTLPCGGTQMVNDVWYSFVYPGDTVSIATHLGSLGDTRIGVSIGCGMPAFACNDDFEGMGLAFRIAKLGKKK